MNDMQQLIQGIVDRWLPPKFPASTIAFQDCDKTAVWTKRLLRPMWLTNLTAEQDEEREAFLYGSTLIIGKREHALWQFGRFVEENWRRRSNQDG